MGSMANVTFLTPPCGHGNLNDELLVQPCDGLHFLCVEDLPAPPLCLVACRR